MSENDPMTDSNEQIPDLSALNFGPAWARDKPKGKPRARQESTGGGERKGQGRGQQGGRQGGAGRRPQSGGRDSRDQRGFQGKGRRDDRRDQGGSRGRDSSQRKPMAPAPDGIAGRIMPIEEGLDALAKDVAATGRTHSVFDIAWMVLGGLERFHVVFESDEQPMYRSKKDHSLWLFQKECMAHFWSSGAVNRYYEEEVVEIDPPKGNFQSVARCGLSGTLIGPPNHHAYQKTLLDLHREKYSNMALDRYKAKIVMEHGEEFVEQWMESMKKHVRWRPKSEEAKPVSDESEVEKTEEAVATMAEPSSEDVVVDETSAPVIEETVAILDSHLEVEQHFLSHGFDQEFETGKIMSVLAKVPAQMIDPGLFTLLKATVSEERRYPGKLASILCRQMSGRHLAVFKWKKHLHCGPARPRKVSDSVVMAERPSELFHWVIANPGGNIDVMWKDVLPADVDDEAKHLWYHDLHWLINEGIVLLFSDGKLHAAKELQPKKDKKPEVKKPQNKKEVVADKPKAEIKESAPEVAPETPVDDAPATEGSESEA